MSFVNNYGVRIHYQVEGAGSPLVLHHGMTDNLVSWQEYGYVKPLKKDYQLVLIDSRGHGASDKPHDPDAYTLPLRVADVVAVLDELGIGKAHYLGYSLSGWIGLGLAKYAPERLQSLIIGGAQPYGHSFKTFRQILRGGIEAWVATAEQMAGPLSPECRQRLLSNDVQALLASITHDRPNIAEMLPSVPLPCLLFAGEADPICGLVRQCANDLPNAAFVSLPSLNHFQTVIRSDLLLPHITSFLAGVDSFSTSAVLIRTAT
jgi:pimeloyl-ACP methyl ester carboxylesterase